MEMKNTLCNTEGEDYFKSIEKKLEYIEKVIADLPESDQLLLDLVLQSKINRENENCFDEIALKMGMSPSEVESRCNRLRIYLRESMERYSANI